MSKKERDLGALGEANSDKTHKNPPFDRESIQAAITSLAQEFGQIQTSNYELAVHLAKAGYGPLEDIYTGALDQSQIEQASHLTKTGLLQPPHPDLSELMVKTARAFDKNVPQAFASDEKEKL